MQLFVILALAISACGGTLPIKSITAADVKLLDFHITNFKAEHVPQTRAITLEFDLMQSDPQSTIYNSTYCQGNMTTSMVSHKLFANDQTDLYAACDNELVFPPRLYLEDEACMLQITFDNYPSAQTFTIGRHRFTDGQVEMVESPAGSGQHWEALVVLGGAFDMTTQSVPYP